MFFQEVFLPCFFSGRGRGQTAIGFVLLMHGDLIGILVILLFQPPADGGTADSI